MHQYISSPKKTAEILSRYGIRLRKALGQNYMIDTNSIKKIVSLADIKNGESILEVGSGIGSLTEILLEGGAGRVVCIEIDKNVSEAFRDILSDKIQAGRIELVEKDAMDIDYGDLCGKYNIKKMVSNLPYKIAAPLIIKVLRQAPTLRRSWVTIQKDIADRILAGKGDRNYSSYTVKSNLLADYRPCFKISRNCFIPKPFVDSMVLEIIRKELPEGFSDKNDVEEFFNFVNSAFLHRRKKLLNSLANDDRYKTSQETIAGLLEDMERDPGIRAEEFSLEDFIHIFKNLRRHGVI